MQGHAAANMVALAASNRIGTEEVNGITMNWYGQSFIADGTGALWRNAVTVLIPWHLPISILKKCGVTVPHGGCSVTGGRKNTTH